MCGTDIPIPGLQVSLYQPRIKDIAMIGDSDFFLGIQCLNINKQMIAQGETLLANTNNFQLFMTIMKEKEAADKKQAVKKIFQLIFPNHNVLFTPASLVLTQQGQENKIIDESNFETFQGILRQVFFSNTGPMDAQAFNPANDKAREIAEKLMRARQRVAAQKQDSNGSVFSQYISTLTVGLPSMSLFDCINLTTYQLFDLIERYMLYINWDLDIRSRLAGGSGDSKPDNWMKNIH